jgi:hypothetical protein
MARRRDVRLVEASQDERLTARIVRRVPLIYNAGPPDRPPHVRAASGVRRLGGQLAVVQDDANWIALVEAGAGGDDAIRAVPLPPGPGGERLLEKKLKLDLEACVVAPGEVLVAFGSGSTAARERVALLLPDLTSALRDAAPLYRALRETVDFAGSELNVEGAVLLGDTLRLFQRGNGAPSEGLQPVDASCDLSWPAVWELIQGGAWSGSPRNVVRYELGLLSDVRLTFTDATRAPGGVVFVAAAEDSPDTFRDGEVVGAAVGTIDGEWRARWTPLTDSGGRLLPVKVEGITLDPAAPSRAVAVLDADDPERPAELLELELDGPW